MLADKLYEIPLKTTEEGKNRTIFVKVIVDFTL